jgi:hypothetical protein
MLWFKWHYKRRRLVISRIAFPLDVTGSESKGNVFIDVSQQGFHMPSHACAMNWFSEQSAL